METKPAGGHAELVEACDGGHRRPFDRLRVTSRRINKFKLRPIIYKQRTVFDRLRLTCASGHIVRRTPSESLSKYVCKLKFNNLNR